MTSRYIAFKALGDYRRNRHADTARDKMLKSPGVSTRDKALALRIFNGVLQNVALCDYYTGFYSSINIKKIEPRVLDILRLSIYQLVFLSRIPYNSAVNEGVSLAKKYANPSAAGYVNAVLRKVAEAAGCGSLPEVTGEPELRLSVRYSHPQWLVREFLALLGTDETERLLAANNDPDTPITAQINTLITDTAAALSLLAQSGVQAVRHEWLEDCITLANPGDVTKLGVFSGGYLYIQDAASRLAVIAAGPAPGYSVLDGCAAPGGKSFTAALLMGNTGYIAACDINPQRLRLVSEGAKRLGLSIIECLECDVSQPQPGITANISRNGRRVVPESIIGADGEKPFCLYDVVFADVPCSGFGVINKKPDVRYKDEFSISSLPEVQKSILTQLSAYVKPGGVLLYSTCTVLKRENEDIINWFLERDDSFLPEGFSLPHIGEVSGGKLTLWPHIHGTDGFFICKLRKRNEQRDEL